jgi:RNA polymerase sigma factor (TIGR02999 family)
MEENPQNSRPITLLLHEWQQGDKNAFDKVIQYVYDDLRRRASAYLKNERREHTLQTTGLVHEAFIKLVDKKEIDWKDRNHFFAIASKVMRRILVDYARSRNRDKRGGKYEDLSLEETKYLSSGESKVDLVALDQALNKLAKFDERQAKIVELKYFGGMTLDETAEILGVSRVTVKRDWNIAKTWLRRQLK